MRALGGEAAHAETVARIALVDVVGHHPRYTTEHVGDVPADIDGAQLVGGDDRDRGRQAGAVRGHELAFALQAGVLRRHHADFRQHRMLAFGKCGLTEDARREREQCPGQGARGTRVFVLVHEASRQPGGIRYGHRACRTKFRREHAARLA
ncbi:hypothetical protein D3C72_1912360 [compost metagenome]